VKLEIREDFRGLIPPLSAAELDQLHKSLLAQGRARDPLVVWKGHGVLLDGHNRYDFCTEKGIPFETVEVRCSSDEAAKNWIILNQLGRRNLSPDAARFLRGKLYNSRKKPTGKPKGVSDQTDHISTAEQVATETGVSAPTVRRDAKFAEAVEVLGVTAEVMSGREKRKPSEIITAAEAVAPASRPKQKRTSKRVKKPLRDVVIARLTKLLKGFKEDQLEEVKSILREQLL
jgi:hypothetical protein